MSEAETAWADAMLAAGLLAVDPGLGGTVVRAAPGPVRDLWMSAFRGLQAEDAPWRRLPLGVEDDRLLGGLDLAAALGGGRRVLQRGLLAEADEGVLVAVMAERLVPATAARLAMAVTEGAIAVERDGIAARLDARLTLVALDEGIGPDERAPAALTERLAFHIDLGLVAPRDALPIEATRAEVAAARATLARAPQVEPEALQAVCAAAMVLGIDSLRAPILALRAARALAALDGREAVDAGDLGTAARLVLTPRATRGPAAESDGSDASDGEAQDQADENGDADPGADGAEIDAPVQPLDDLVLQAALAALPEDLAALWAERGKALRSNQTPSGGAGARRASATRGRRIGVRAGAPRGGAVLDLVETLKAAAPWQRVRGRSPPIEAGSPLHIRSSDFRIRRYEQRSEATVIFVVDASGSSALQRLAEAKGAVELLLAEAYVRRTQVALIAFRGVGAELLLPPTRSLTRARRSLAELAGGGATPLAAALDAGSGLAAAERAKGRTPLLIVLTDGRGNISLNGSASRSQAEADALATASVIRAARFGSALIDTSPRPRGDGARLADAMGARFAPLPYVEAEAVRNVVRGLDDGSRP